MTAGAQPGRLVTMRADSDESDGDSSDPAPPARAESDAVSFERLNLHASVTLGAHDDAARERLCRYLLRPAFSLARIRVRKDGGVSYRVKKLGRRRATHRVMTPVEFLARLGSCLGRPLPCRAPRVARRRRTPRRRLPSVTSATPRAATGTLLSP